MTSTFLSTANGTTLYAEKIEADNRLMSAKRQLSEDMLYRSRERHFRKAPTEAFERQFSQDHVHSDSLGSQPEPLQYSLEDRAEIVRLTCSPVGEASAKESLERRIRAIQLRTALCQRRQPRNWWTNDRLSKSLPQGRHKCEATIPIMCKPLQCTFCLGDESLPYQARTIELGRTHDLWNHVEHHLSNVRPGIPILCKHPACVSTCGAFSSRMKFKSHTARIHGIKLRPDV